MNLRFMLMVYHVSEHAALHNVGHRLGPQEDESRLRRMERRCNEDV